MNNFSDLISYFENLAKSHVSIQHTAASKKFFRMEIDEVLGGFNRTDIAFPIVILEGYNFKFTDNRSDNLIKDRSGAFILLDKVSDIHDFNKIHEIWDNLEVIGDDFLMKFKKDKHNPETPVIRDFNFNSVESALIRNEIGNLVGIRYLFTISSPISNEMDNSKWMEI